MPDDNLDRAIALSRSGRKLMHESFSRQFSDPIHKMKRPGCGLPILFQIPIIVLQLEECLKHSPDSHAAQKWLATFKSEEAKTATTIQPQKSGTQTNQITQPKQPIIKSLLARNLSQKLDIKQRTKIIPRLIFLASAFGTIILLSMGIFGLWIMQRQGMLTIPAVENPLYPHISARRLILKAQS